jgi:predicted acetyltransferase
MLVLVEPTIADKEQLLAYKSSFAENNEVMHGGSGLDAAATIDDWFALLEAYKVTVTVPAGHVPSRTYLAKEDGKVIGIVNLRLELNDYLLQHGGHIGYSVKKEYRQQGYGVEILAQTLILAQGFGLDKVLVTCDDQNQASRRVIEKNGGQLEDIRVDSTDGSLTRRYWFTINR